MRGVMIEVGPDAMVAKLALGEVSARLPCSSCKTTLIGLYSPTVKSTPLAETPPGLSQTMYWPMSFVIERQASVPGS